MMIYTTDGLEKKLKRLEKYGWVFYGFDKLEICDLFIRKGEYYTERIEIAPYSICFKGWRFDGTLEFEHHPVILEKNEIDEFYDLLNYMSETNKILPLKFAKHQKELDDDFKFECGD